MVRILKISVGLDKLNGRSRACPRQHRKQCVGRFGAKGIGFDNFTAQRAARFDQYRVKGHWRSKGDVVVVKATRPTSA